MSQTPTKGPLGLYIAHQNNSGGSFYAPAVNLLIEAETAESAIKLAESQITFCGSSGRYADYDDCGCCPCCGHRWEMITEDDRAEGDSWQLINLKEPKEMMRWGMPSYAFLDKDGLLVVGDTEAKFDLIRSKALTLAKEGGQA